ncbi:MAG: ATP-binding protein [bacterium]|nr:ATP-binding protein [bacterium]
MSIIRNLTLEIEKHLQEDEVILIAGARQAGKTTLLHQLEEAIKTRGNICHFLNLEDPEFLSLLNESPKNLLKIFSFDLSQKNFVLIDEIQYLKDPTNFLKYFYDEYGGKIKIIATGSSVFYLDRKFKDSLVGRKKIFNLFTLSFREFLKFKNEGTLSEGNFNNLSISEKEKIKLYYREYIIYGGYPKVALAPVTEKEDVLKDIAYSYIKKDIFEANIRQEDIFYKLFKILASQTGNLVNSSELASTLGVSRTAVEDYLYIMQKSFHIRLISPFYANLRKEITKMPKVYFLDLGLRNFLFKNFKPLEQREDNGQILENALFRQFLENYDFEEIKFWRTAQKQEVDFVIKGSRAFEVKANPEKFKKNKYKAFFGNYPQIEFFIASFDCQKEKIDGIPIVEIWRE